MANTTKKLIQGFGINDLDYPIKNCPYYERWKSLICRCYSDKFHIYNKSYKNSEVCEEWKYLSNFKSWMESKDWENKVLDKDILYPGNKLYSPKTCIFVSKEINSLIIKPTGRDLPLGAYKNIQNNKYDSKISMYTKRIYLGSFLTPFEAHRCWQINRSKYIEEVAMKQEDEILKGALLRISNSIIDDYMNFRETKY